MGLSKSSRHLIISSSSKSWLKSNLDFQLKNLTLKECYAFIIYDLDAPQGIYIHYLALNLSSSRKQKTTECKFKALNPPAGHTHKYVFELYHQQSALKPQEISPFVDCQVSRLITHQQLDNLLEVLGKPIDRIELDLADPPAGMKGSSKKAKYCHCLLEVEAKNEKVRSPYAICASSVGTSTGSHPCTEHYDFPEMDNKYLRAWLKLHHISSEGLTRPQMLSKINTKIAEE